MTNERHKGKLGEELAAYVLEGKGYQIIERNYSTKFGEIDIIAVKGGCIHFAEVKTRTGDEYGYPAEAVDKTKRRRIRMISDMYLGSRHMEHYDISFDVIEIEISHIENCF